MSNISGFGDRDSDPPEKLITERRGIKRKSSELEERENADYTKIKNFIVTCLENNMTSFDIKNDYIDLDKILKKGNLKKDFPKLSFTVEKTRLKWKAKDSKDLDASKEVPNNIERIKAIINKTIKESKMQVDIPTDINISSIWSSLQTHFPKHDLLLNRKKTTILITPKKA